MKARKKTYGVISFSFLLLLYFLAKGVKYSSLAATRGKVTAMYETRVSSFRYSRSGKHYYPLIEYYLDNNKHEFADETRYYFRAYKKGEDVKLIYNPENTSEVYINSLFGFWLSLQSVILIFFAGILIYGIITTVL